MPKEHHKSEYDELKLKYSELENKYSEILDSKINMIHTIDELKLNETKYIELEKSHARIIVENEYLKKSVEDLTQFKENYILMLEKSFDTNIHMFDANNKIMELNNETSIKSLSTVKYISKHLNKAPPLTYEKKEIVGLLEHTSSKRYKPVDYIIYNQSIKKLDKWIGDIIIKIYKKENPFDQSIWATDTSRFSYLVCEVVDSASGIKHEWITDKSGTKVTEIIINPTLELLSKMLEIYIQETLKLNIDEMEICEVNTMFNNRIRSHEIIKEIKDNNLHKDVLKYITPFLSADQTKIEDALIKQK
jgi:hypothetical protein